MKTQITVSVVILASLVGLFCGGTLITSSAASFSIFSEPQNLGPNINAVGINNELSLISPSGLSMYFMSNNRADGLGGNDIYLSQRATLSSAWGPAQNLAVLNTAQNESPGSISPDGREMFFVSTRPTGIGGPDLWRSTRIDPFDDFGWSTPVNLGSTVNSNVGDQTPFYFVDQATGMGTLFFSSDRESGTNNIKDIYQATRNPDGTFNPPTPVTELNSSADDNRPTISRDGLEMFFGTVRTGTRAIYRSTRASTTSPWNPPIPVGVLNGGGVAAQPYLSADGSVLYFTSNRPGGLGTGDIYSSVRVNTSRSASTDFDGDGKSDISVFRPSEGTWHILGSETNTYSSLAFGLSGDKVVAADYDGDGRIDIAVFRPSTGVWWIRRTSDGVVAASSWGLTSDRPVPGDYDGDGRADIAIYRNGTWIVQQSSNGSVNYQQFGLSTDVPIVGSD